MIVNPALVSPPARVIAQDALAIKQVFQSINAESCPSSYNFHMHTLCSDGRLEPEALVEQAISLGLKGFSITDHHTIRGYQRAKDWIEDWQWRHPHSHHSTNTSLNGSAQSTLPRLWPGIEITADLVGTEVHILGYAFDPKGNAIQPYLSGAPRGQDRLAAAVINAIQTAGGLAVLAHPLRYRTPAKELIAAAAKLGLDGVEAYYAYDNPKIWRSSPKKTEAIETLAIQFNLLKTCGTDTHGSSLLRRL